MELGRTNGGERITGTARAMRRDGWLLQGVERKPDYEEVQNGDGRKDGILNKAFLPEIFLARRVGRLPTASFN